MTDLFYEAKTYVANILMLYAMPVAKAVAAVRGLDPKIICPSHGVVWRSKIKEILDAYDRWDCCTPERKVIVIYDTMWKSTEMMAEAIVEGAIAEGGPALDVKLFNVRANTGTLSGHGDPGCGGHRRRLAHAERHADAGGGGCLDLFEGLAPGQQGGLCVRQLWLGPRRSGRGGALSAHHEGGIAAPRVEAPVQAARRRGWRNAARRAACWRAMP